MPPLGEFERGRSRGYSLGELNGAAEAQQPVEGDRVAEGIVLPCACYGDHRVHG